MWADGPKRAIEILDAEAYSAKREEAMNLPVAYLQAFVEGYEAALGSVRKFFYKRNLSNLPPEVKAIKDVLKERTELSDKL
ncbi:hypothetical protein JXB28_05075 [Candidatus Woesearchaeota archaeon]|nr:hypothetical protein [Candidatus Woesearchaeota archaeon]